MNQNHVVGVCVTDEIVLLDSRTQNERERIHYWSRFVKNLEVWFTQEVEEFRLFPRQLVDTSLSSHFPVVALSALSVCFSREQTTPPPLSLSYFLTAKHYS